MTRLGAALSLALGLVGLLSGEARSADVDSTWIGPSGEWTNGALWSTAPVYPENDVLTYAAIVDAAAAGGFNVQLSSDLTADSLFLRNSNLSNGATLTLENGLMLRDFGRISGGTVIASGASTFSGVEMRLERFVNEGATDWQAGGLTLGFSGAVTNAADATFTVSGSANRTLSGLLRPTFQNDGTLLHASTGSTSLQASFSNAGVVQVQSGTLMLASGGASTGEFNVASGATLGYSGELLESARVLGAGNLVLTSSLLLGQIAMHGTTTIGGQVDIASLGNTTARLVIAGGGVTQLRVDGSLDVSDELVWQRGTIRGAGSIAFGGPLTIEAEFEKSLEGFELNAQNGILWRGGVLSLVSGARLVNESSSALVIDTSAEAVSAAGAPGDAVVRNEGSLEKTGAANAYLQVDVENVGSMGVEEGNLWINGAFTNGGAISIADGAVLQLGQGAEFLDTSSVSGGGTLRLWGSGTKNLRGPLSVGALDLDGQTSVHFLDPIVAFDGVFSMGQSVAASFEAAPVDLGNVTAFGGTLSLPGSSRLAGTYDWQFGTIVSDGPIELDGAARITQAYAIGAGLRNVGSLEIDNGSLSLEQGAMLVNSPGATLRFTGQSSGIFGDGTTSFLNQGSVIDENDSSLGSSETNINLRFVNQGSFEVHGDGFDGPFGSTTRFTDFRQTDGTLYMNGGTIESFIGAPLRVDAGSVIGNGTVYVDVENRGRIAPGDPGEAGRLVFGTRLSLFDGSLLDIELGGTEPGLEHDVIDASRIFLDGELAVRFIDGFEQVIGSSDEFEIARASTNLQGILDNVVSGARILTADGIGTFAVYYGATSPFEPNQIVLTDFAPVPEPVVAALLGIAAFGLLALRARR